MENASQALIIGGTILIAIIVLSMGVYLFTNATKVGESYQQAQEVTELARFNARFTAFEGREDITAQEIVTLANYVINYNAQNGTTIEVCCPNNIATNTRTSEENIAFVQDNAPYDDGSGNTLLKRFKCVDNGGNPPIEYVNGRVSKITFTGP